MVPRPVAYGHMKEPGTMMTKWNIGTIKRGRTEKSNISSNTKLYELVSVKHAIL